MRLMRRAATRLGLATAAVLLMAAPTAAGPQASDAEIRQILIWQSIASYARDVTADQVAAYRRRR